MPNNGLVPGARGLVQNRNALLNTNAFAPRGYDVNALPGGVYVQLEAEVIQPLWSVDDGLTILPLYAKVLSVYGFGEILRIISDDETLR